MRMTLYLIKLRADKRSITDSNREHLIDNQRLYHFTNRPYWARDSNSLHDLERVAAQPHCITQLERQFGIEPKYPTWKEGVIAVILLSHGCGAENRTQGEMLMRHSCLPTSSPQCSCLNRNRTYTVTLTASRSTFEL
jgi:hypothetical protein